MVIATPRAALLLLLALQGLSWLATLAQAEREAISSDLSEIVADLTNRPHDDVLQVKEPAGGGDIHLDEIDLDDLPGDAGSRKLMSSILGGPLPGLTLIPPGFPAPKPLSAASLGLMGHMGVLGKVGASELAFASYVVEGTDPVAIALRQLSIVAIESYGTAVQNSIRRAVARIDARLARYSSFLKREARALKKADAQDLLAAVQREIRMLVIARAALKDLSARQVAYVRFLTSAASSWTSWFYGIQFRFTTLVMNIQFFNDAVQLELNRVLYNLGDVTRLVGLLLKPFIDAWKFEQKFFNTLYNIIFRAYVRERNRLTITPVATLMYRFGSGKNIQFMIDRVTSLAEALGAGGNADALLAAARSARDQVAAALQMPARSAAAAAGQQMPALQRLADMLRSRVAAGGS